MSVGDHIAAMSERLARDAARAGVHDADVDRLCRVFSAVAEARAARIGNRQHHSVLHTARTALILIADCDINDPALLTAATALDTLDPQLMPGLDTLPLAATERALAAQAFAAVNSEIVLEELLLADQTVRLLALAEALDHARHLHRQPAAAWAPFHEAACSVFLPIAGRTHDALARRFNWWCDMFRSRYLRP